MKSLKSQNHSLSESLHQLEVLGNSSTTEIPFEDKLKGAGLFPFRTTSIEIFQINVGKMCNQVCKHCHVDAGPDRKEIMSRDTMQLCLDILKDSPINIVDLTGGAPEMNPHFRWFVSELFQLGKKVMVRCNLTIILANKKYNDLPQFFKDHGVEVVSSLPFYTASRTDNQRGKGVFDQSIEALKLLNEVGYGIENSGYILNLVYNPAGAFFPGDQRSLEREFKRELEAKYNVCFNNLFTITNLPVSRFLDYLISSGNYDQYMEKLINAFNPVAATNVMCRNTISVGWDGYLYDCDFNQMLDLKVSTKESQHLRDFDIGKLQDRTIITNQHCYGCTAGAGSSCGGAVA